MPSHSNPPKPLYILKPSSLLSVSPHCDSVHLSSPFPLCLTTSSSHLFSIQPLIAAFILFLSFHPCLLSSSSLWSDWASLFRQGYHHALPVVTYCPCSLLGITSSAAPFSLPTHTFTQTQSALPYPFGDCLTNKAFCRFYADVRRPTPLGPRSTCLAALLRLMNNAVNRITFYHLIVSAQQ